MCNQGSGTSDRPLTWWPVNIARYPLKNELDILPAFGNNILVYANTDRIQAFTVKLSLKSLTHTVYLLQNQGEKQKIPYPTALLENRRVETSTLHELLKYPSPKQALSTSGAERHCVRV